MVALQFSNTMDTDINKYHTQLVQGACNNTFVYDSFQELINSPPVSLVEVCLAHT
jgi:hypothetical protein